MISLDEARDVVLAGCTPLSPAPVPLREAVGLVLAEPIVATELIPPFANTAVDGYAVRAVDTHGASQAQPVTLAVLATLAAGAAATETVGPGQAMRIMTGAPIPAGADAVVMVEDTTPAGGAHLGGRDEARAERGGPDRGGLDKVQVLRPVAAGDAVRPAGDDVKPGDRLFEPGDVLSPAHVGVLASLGYERVVAYRRARVGVVSTGDELVEGPVPLKPGQIRDSNRVTLLALVEAAGAEAVDLGLIADDEAAIAAAFEQGAATCDALISSGGVSMGEFDFVKRVLDRVGEMNWMQVAIRPAKPLAFGHVAGKPVFGLPGNPVSSMVSFELFARPGLRKLMGHPAGRWHREPVVAVAPAGLERGRDGKVHFFRVAATYRNGRYEVRPSGGQGSHQLSAMAAANALAVVADGDGVAPGGSVDVLLFG